MIRKKLIEIFSNEFKMSHVDITLVPQGIRVGDHIYTSTKGFTTFIITRDVTEGDITREEEKIKDF